MGSQRLSAQHLPGSWQQSCTLSEAAPSSTGPSAGLLHCAQTHRLHLGLFYISSATPHHYEPLPDKYDRVPSAACQCWEPPVPKHSLEPPFCVSSAGAGTTPWH